MSKVLLEYVHFDSLLVSLLLLEGGAVFADIVGLDVLRPEAVEGVDSGGYRLGGLVLLGGGYRQDVCSLAQHSSLEGGEYAEEAEVEGGPGRSLVSAGGWRW